MSETKLRLARQNLAKFRASLAWEADKDGVRRRIEATQARIKAIEAEMKGETA